MPQDTEHNSPSTPPVASPDTNFNPLSPSALSPPTTTGPQVTVSPPRFTQSPDPESPRREQSSNGASKQGNNNPKNRHIRLPTHLHRPHLESGHRSLSEVIRAVRSREEQETLLEDDEIADPDGCLREDGGLFGPREVFFKDPHAALKVYWNIHRIRRIIIASVEDPYTFEQLKEPRLNVLMVKPLVDRLYDEDDVSVVYCLLVNRLQFLREQHFHHHHQSVNLTRANLCELIAMKMLRRYDEENSGRPGLLLLANILVAPFQPFQNAPAEVCPDRHISYYQNQGGYEGKLTALEVAIISESKVFLSSSACQKVIDAVYRGRIVYTPTTFLNIIPDHYKHKPISLYDPRKAPVLNQYRLIVPRTRNVIEVVQFIILLVLYCLCMVNRKDSDFSSYEVWFMVYGSGWVLDECASILEHGWLVHTQNLWAFLDITFVIIYFAYFIMRMHAYRTNNGDLGGQALDILAIAAPILFPRLAFNLMPENMLFISLRAMMKEFTALSLIAVWCFGGFLVSLKWLAIGNTSPSPHLSPETPDSVSVGKWMLWIWFGLDGTGIEEAPRFHRILGPTLMVIYAFLGNTLFLTVLVSILSNTFSKIAADATAEIQFRRAVLTFEGVKSDALFAYRPPLNVFALLLLPPLKVLLEPRWFHKINVWLVRLHNAPLLLLIAMYERRYLWNKRGRQLKVMGPSKRSKWTFWAWSNLNVHADLQAVFDEDPPPEVLEQMEQEEDDGLSVAGAVVESFSVSGPSGVGPRDRSVSPGHAGVYRRRRLSSVWQG